MGAFSEIVLSFNFANDTPSDVLAAFSALALPHLTGGAPRLPTPAVEAWEVFAPDWRDLLPEGDGDPFESEPWKHDWATWVSTSMGVGTTPHGTLAWSELGTWNLDCRFSWKTVPGTVSAALSWLAPFVDTTFSNGKVLVGYVHYAYRPHLFWVDAGRWELENLNPNDEWTWG